MDIIWYHFRVFHFEPESLEIIVDGGIHIINLHILEESEILKDPEIDAYILCCSIENKKSFKNIKKKWAKILKDNGRNGPCILVGEYHGYFNCDMLFG